MLPLPIQPRLPAPAAPQVLRSRLQQRMDARTLQYTGVGDVIRKTLQVCARTLPLLPSCRAAQNSAVRASDQKLSDRRQLPIVPSGYLTRTSLFP